MYFVFERNDGYFGVISSVSVELGRQRLASYGIGPKRVSFEILLETEDWAKARELLQEKRGVVDAVIDVKPPVDSVDPAEVKRRAVDNIAVQLTSIRDRLRHVHLETTELHGMGHPAQATLELALIALGDAIRFNKKGEF